MSVDPLKAFVIGMGEVGRRLASALAAAGVEALPVTRASGWDEALTDHSGLVLVCVREEALAEVVARLRGVASRRLVFVQNGWVRPLLAASPSCSRGLIWFTSKSDFFRVLRPSVFSGSQAQSIAAILNRGGVPSVAVDEPAFAAAEAEKMGFNCVVGLPLAVHQVRLADYLEKHLDEAQAVFEEAAGVTARALAADASPQWWVEFLHLSVPLGWVRTAAAKALEYRNGAVVRLARDLGLDAPTNARLLKAIGFPV
jgi:ketopantoate reductase